MTQLPQIGDKNWGPILNGWLSTVGDSSNGGFYIVDTLTDLSSSPYTTLPDNTTVFLRGEKKLYKKETGSYVEKLNFSSTFSSTTPPSTPNPGDTYYNTNDNTIYYWDGSSWSIGGSSPTGSLQMFAGSAAPSGWLLCKGQEVSRTTYSALFSVISTTYGAGDGSTTFNLPNFQGKTAFGVSDSDSAFNLAVSGGSKTKNVSHTHSITAQSAATTSSDGDHTHTTYGENQTAVTAISGAGVQAARAGHDHAMNFSGGHSHTVPLHNHGGATASGASGTQDVLNPYVAVNYIIKT